jgi:hypothetical protein
LYKRQRDQGYRGAVAIAHRAVSAAFDAVNEAEGWAKAAKGQHQSVVKLQSVFRMASARSQKTLHQRRRMSVERRAGLSVGAVIMLQRKVRTIVARRRQKQQLSKRHVRRAERAARDIELEVILDMGLLLAKLEGLEWELGEEMRARQGRFQRRAARAKGKRIEAEAKAESERKSKRREETARAAVTKVKEARTEEEQSRMRARAKQQRAKKAESMARTMAQEAQREAVSGALQAGMMRQEWKELGGLLQQLRVTKKPPLQPLALIPATYTNGKLCEYDSTAHRQTYAGIGSMRVRPSSSQQVNEFVRESVGNRLWHDQQEQRQQEDWTHRKKLAKLTKTAPTIPTRARTARSAQGRGRHRRVLLPPAPQSASARVMPSTGGAFDGESDTKKVWDLPSRATAKLMPSIVSTNRQKSSSDRRNSGSGTRSSDGHRQRLRSTSLSRWDHTSRRGSGEPLFTVEEAAVFVQAKYRQRKANRMLRRRRESAVRVEQQQRNMEKSQAAGAIQARFRTQRASRVYELMYERHKAAVKMQSLIRQRKAKGDAARRMDEREGVLFIQSVVRMFIASNRVRWRRRTNQAARVLQGTQRKWKVRRERGDRLVAAMAVQGAWRGKVARGLTESHREFAELARRAHSRRQENAAVQIQARVRGGQAARATGAQLRLLLRLQARVRAWTARRRIAKDLSIRYQAALALPGTVQGRSGFYEGWSKDVGCLLVSQFEVADGGRAWNRVAGPWNIREWSAMRAEERTSKRAAATKMQGAARRRNAARTAQSKRTQRTRAAIVVQTSVRGVLRRAETMERRQRARADEARAAAEKEANAILFVQAWVRGQKGRAEASAVYALKKRADGRRRRARADAAVRLQCWIRQKMAEVVLERHHRRAAREAIHAQQKVAAVRMQQVVRRRQATIVVHSQRAERRQGAAAEAMQAIARRWLASRRIQLLRRRHDASLVAEAAREVASKQAVVLLQSHVRMWGARHHLLKQVEQAGGCLALPGTVPGRSGFYEYTAEGQVMVCEFEVRKAEGRREVWEDSMESALALLSAEEEMEGEEDKEEEEEEEEEEEWVAVGGPWTRREYGARIARLKREKREREKRKAQKRATIHLHWAQRASERRQEDEKQAQHREPRRREEQEERGREERERERGPRIEWLQEQASLLVQGRARILLARRVAAGIRRAVLKLQQMARGRLARRQVEGRRALEKDAREEKRAGAACVLQRAGRVRGGRVKLKERKAARVKAAIRLQCFGLQVVAMGTVRVMRQALEEERRRAVQRAVVFMAAAVVFQWTDEATRLVAGGALARLETRSALIIQCAARKRSSIRQVETRRLRARAGAVIGAHVRGWLARKTAERMRQGRACVLTDMAQCIQRAWRISLGMKAARRRVAKQLARERAATVIQAAARAKGARRRTARLKATKELERRLLVPQHQQQEVLMRTKGSAVVVLQSWARQIIARSEAVRRRQQAQSGCTLEQIDAQKIEWKKRAPEWRQKAVELEAKMFLPCA